MAIEKLLEKIDLGKETSAAEAVAQELAESLTTGLKVAVIGDPTYPFDGQKGTIKELNNGFALVEFSNGTKVNLLASLLVPVK